MGGVILAEWAVLMLPGIIADGGGLAPILATWLGVCFWLTFAGCVAAAVLAVRGVVQ